MWLWWVGRYGVVATGCVGITISARCCRGCYIVWLSTVARHTGRLGSQDYLGSDVGIQINVLVPSDVGRASRPVESLHGNFPRMLRSDIQVYHSMDTLRSLSLDDLVFGHSLMQKHDFCPQSFGFESILYPSRELAMNIRLQNNLHIRDVGSISARKVEFAVLTASSVGTWAPLTIVSATSAVVRGA